MADDESSIVPQHLNPQLDPELAREVAFFTRWGYPVLEDAIDHTQVENLRQALDASFQRKGEQFIHQLLEEDRRFLFLLDHPPVLRRMKAILGNCIQLHSATARVTEPGQEDQHWHRDGPWPVDPAGTPYGSMPGQINCGYFLDELTADNGPIAILPGSKRHSRSRCRCCVNVIPKSEGDANLGSVDETVHTLDLRRRRRRPALRPGGRARRPRARCRSFRSDP